jgi:hypothetical protein
MGATSGKEQGIYLTASQYEPQAASAVPCLAQQDAFMKLPSHYIRLVGDLDLRCPLQHPSKASCLQPLLVMEPYWWGGLRASPGPFPFPLSLEGDDRTFGVHLYCCCHTSLELLFRCLAFSLIQPRLQGNW